MNALNQKLTVGSLCSGYGGIELSLQMMGLDIQVPWFCETDSLAAETFATRFRHPVNLGDIRDVGVVEPVDVICAGVPCQPFSVAGNKQGVNDDRWLIDLVAPISRRAEAGVLLFENVSGILSASNGTAFRDFLHSLAHHGFDAVWTTVSADEAGAPHQRDRWWCLAWDTERGPGVVADTFSGGVNTNSRFRAGNAGSWSGVEPAAVSPGPGMALAADSDQVDTRGVHSGTSFGQWQDAIDRWAAITRPVPEPVTMDKRRHCWDLNPVFSEWFMGLPQGWISDITNDPRLVRRLAGNGVVPQASVLAFRLLASQVMFSEDQK